MYVCILRDYRGFWVGYSRVRVWVGKPVPSPNLYLKGVGGFADTKDFIKKTPLLRFFMILYLQTTVQYQLLWLKIQRVSLNLTGIGFCNLIVGRVL